MRLNKKNVTEMTNAEYYGKLQKYKSEYPSFCLHPNKSECRYENKKPRNHSLPRNRVLKLLVDCDEELFIENPKVRNHVFTITFNKEGADVIPVGISSQASIFSAFCNYHDGIIFENIDNQPLDVSNILGLRNEQLVLFMYRAFAYYYYEFLKSKQCIYKLDKEFTFKDDLKEYKKMKRGLVPTTIELRKTKRNLEQLVYKKKNYSKFDYTIIKLDYEVSFACTHAGRLLVDLIGNYFFSKGNGLALCFLTVIPQEGKSYIIFSWLKNEAYLFNRLKEQLQTIHKKNLLNYLNNYIASYVENIYLSPRLWLNWTSKQKEEFIIMREYRNEFLDKSEVILFTRRKYDLFSNLK